MPLARRSLLLAGLWLIAAVPVAPTPSPPQTLDQWAAAKLARDDYTVTSAELSLVPGSTPAVAAYNTKRRRDVLDAMVKARKAAPGGYARWIKIFFPDRPNTFDRPLLADAPALAFRGDGLNTTWQMLYGRDDTLLICGVGNPPLSPDHFFPVAGLDASVTTPRFGLRTKADLHLAHSAGCLAYPAGYWATSTGVTLNFALDTTDAPVPTTAAIAGLCEGQRPCPFFVWTQDGQLKFYVGAIQPDGSTRAFAASVAMPVDRGPHRYSLQHDLASGACTAIVDGVVSHPVMGHFQYGVIPPGSHFPANETLPFLIGALGEGANSTGGASFFSAPSDLALMGFHVSDRPVYRPDGTRLDGLPDTDQLRYFTAKEGTAGLLPFDQPPAEVAASRLVNVLSGPAAGTGPRGSTALALSLDHASPYAAIGGYDLRDLKFGASTWSPWGAALSLGYALWLDARDCTFGGGAHGVASLRFGANYPIRLRDCSASGSDAALFNRYGMWTVERLHIPNHGRATVRNETGLIEANDWFVEYGGTPKWFYRGTEGARLVARKIKVDIESGNYPTEAYFHAEGGPNDPGGVGGGLKLTDVSLGLIQPNQTLIRTRDGSGTGFARVDVDSLTWVGGPDRTKLFDLQGSRWVGSIRVDQPVTIGANPTATPAVTIDQPGTPPIIAPPIPSPVVIPPTTPVIRPTIKRAA